MYLTPKRILLAGAQSYIGAKLLDYLLSEPVVENVTAPSPTPLAPHRKLVNPTGPLRDNLPSIMGRFQLAFCCLDQQVTTADTNDDFRIVDPEEGLLFTAHTRALDIPHLVLMSVDPGDPAINDRMKAHCKRLEDGVKTQGWPILTIARPAFLDHQEPSFLENITAPLSRFFSGKPLPADSGIVAHALWRLGQEEDAPLRIVDSDALRTLGQ